MEVHLSTPRGNQGRHLSAGRRRITWKVPSKPPIGTPIPKEYRVFADLEIALPAGTTYTLVTTQEKCVNDRLHGTFTTKTSPEKTVLWMDASESFYPACWSLISYLRWDFRVDAPFKGHSLIQLGQGVNGGPYTTRCEDWYLNNLKCEQTKALGLRISR